MKAACRAVTDALGATPKSDMHAGWERVNNTIAHIIHFERLAKDLVNRQRARLPWLDLTAEVDPNEMPEKPTENMALTVLTYAGPLFSSLPKSDNITVPSAVSSRASSASGSPKSPTSTAATSVSDWPKTKPESLSVMTPFVEPSIPLPLISTAKAATNKSVAKVPKIGEIFAPPGSVSGMQVPSLDFTKVGMKWGGEVGPGGAVAHPEIDYQSEIAGQWLQYTNYPQPGFSRMLPDPYRQGIGLPGNFVAAYSTFAPTRDNSYSKVPQSISSAIWWDRRGGKVFRRMFGQDEVLGHMFKEYEKNEAPTAPAKPTSEEVDQNAISD